MQEHPVEAILDAARDQFVAAGVRRSSADDIARRAGVNRATIYRRVGTKEEIVRATYVHEAQRVLAAIEQAIGPVPDPGPASADFDAAEYVAAFFTVTITALRENKLLRQLLDVDPDETLAGLTLRAGDVIALASTLAADRMRRLRAYVGNTHVDDIDDLAGTFARIAQSLLLTPDAPPRLTTEASMRDYARRVIAPMVLGR
ncbi:TetR/AcrR family transcriptional regulator [Nocardioides terrisoli]|uniref:TetR/AcrR family transcriptional regulator n=1 Tax=Nocardioides terrisoli TaxID=3388267 RepID=UPI00287BA388|nr:helix-turn-helix domain-containing protein [Nocardioides marmorisolisilvae]